MASEPTNAAPVTEWGARCRDCSFAVGPVPEAHARHVASAGTATGHVIDVVKRTVTLWEVVPDGN
jgi:hypothetical protein